MIFLYLINSVYLVFVDFIYNKTGYRNRFEIISNLEEKPIHRFGEPWIFRV